MDELKARRPWWLWVAAGLGLLICGASVRFERAEYRDGAGNVVAAHSAVLLPWQRMPPIEGDRTGAVTRRGSFAFGLVRTQRRETVTVRTVGP